MADGAGMTMGVHGWDLVEEGLGKPVYSPNFSSLTNMWFALLIILLINNKHSEW